MVKLTNGGNERKASEETSEYLILKQFVQILHHHDWIPISSHDDDEQSCCVFCSFEEAGFLASMGKIFFFVGVLFTAAPFRPFFELEFSCFNSHTAII